MDRIRATASGLLLVLLAACAHREGVGAGSPEMAMDGPRLPGACEESSASKDGSIGCYFDVALELSNLPREVYWHIHEHPDRAAAEAARGPGSVVATAYGRTFLYSVNGVDRPVGSQGRHLASIGPFPSPTTGKVTARFMQATTEPGAMTRVHTHDGPEAFFLLSGAICMDSPEGAAVTGAGRTYWIGGGIPMQLHHSGNEVRRSIFVVLHPSSEPWMKMSNWTPTGGCAH